MTARPRAAGQTGGELPAEVREALEDLRRIREVIDESEETHPLRLVMRPLMLFAALMGPPVIAFGMAAEWIVDRGEPLFGLSPAAVIWIIAGVTVLIATVAKSMIIASTSRRAGYDVTHIYRALFSRDWVRLVLPTFVLTLLASTTLAAAGEASAILGVVTVGVGGIWISYGTIFPLRELSGLGMVLMALGVAATFLFPEWTFYKLAAIWGVCFSIGGAVLYRRFPPLPRVEDSDDQSQ